MLSVISLFISSSECATVNDLMNLVVIHLHVDIWYVFSLKKLNGIYLLLMSEKSVIFLVESAVLHDI